jgi:hypothetical protein
MSSTEFSFRSDAPFGPLSRLPMSRRAMLRRSGAGIGGLSLAFLMQEAMQQEGWAGVDLKGAPLAPRQSPRAVKAKRVIQIFAPGAPSHVDTLDPKPALKKYAGQALPNLRGKAFPSPFEFKRFGKSGLELSEVFGRLGEHADEMAVIRSMFTNVPAHDVAQIFMNTGSLRLPRPSLGAWALYGLGSENQNLPGFIALKRGNSSTTMTASCQSSFLPGVFQGTLVDTTRSTAQEMIENLRNPFMGLSEQRRQLDFVNQVNKVHQAKLQEDAQLEARLQAFEIAFKMQTEATDAFDLSKESSEVREAYGEGGLGQQLLLARRLSERGVRFVQVWHGGWDMHNDLEARMGRVAEEVDRPAAALLADLKSRGLLDETLVIWGGEFGRTVTYDNNGNEKPGRDHNGRAFSIWMAGGGVKGGQAYGATDEFGAKSVENKVHIHDLHATILALLGFDHQKLTYRVNGRDFRLTDVAGNVIKEIIA